MSKKETKVNATTNSTPPENPNSVKKKRKKWPIILSVLIAIALLGSGCSESEPAEPAEPSGNVFLEASLKSMDLTVGTCEYIEVSKEDAKSASVDDYKAFLESVVDQSEANYVSIMFGDDTGIVFPKTSMGIAEYGDIDSEGGITNSYGQISRDGEYNKY